MKVKRNNHSNNRELEFCLLTQ